MDAIVRLIGEINIAFRINRRPFGELETVREFFELRLLGNDGTFLACAGRLVLLGGGIGVFSFSVSR